MRSGYLLGVLCLAGAGAAQNLTSVYNRDSGESFSLKSVKTHSIVKGPIVKTTTVYTFHNPYKNLTEASFNFSLPWGSALGGFAYWYKNEYVPGMLMDKDQAWFIYTAITSRNRDPGIMDQVAPDAYHAQIYPLAVGYDLRIELTSIDFLQPKPDRFVLPMATWPQGQEVKPEWQVDVESHGLIKMTMNDKVERVRQGFAVDDPFETSDNGMDINYIAEKGPDGAIYVAGTCRSLKPMEIDENSVKTFGFDEDWVWSPYVDSWKYEEDPYSFHFVGKMKEARGAAIRIGDRKFEIYPRNIQRGNWASKLYAQAMLTHIEFKNKQAVLDFSLKYQVPSRFTALLAVPKEEWKLFEEKKKEFQRQEAARRRKAERDQQNRPIPGTANPFNWSTSRGGDPEIRVHEPKAQRAEAVLPDGRVLTLKPEASGWWKGNFEIPASAPEGEYEVKIRFFSTKGLLREQVIKYKVDRTVPEGKLSISGLTLTIESEPGLHDVTLQTEDGKIVKFAETSPGVYQLTLSKLPKGRAVVVLKDDGSNKKVIPCTWPGSR